MSLVPVEAERAVIGAVLSGEWCPEAEELRPLEFGEPRHALVWAAVLWLRGNGRHVEHLGLAERLKDRGELADVGGPEYLMECDAGSNLGLGMVGHIATVRDRASRRAILLTNAATTARAHDIKLEPAQVALDGANALAELGAAGSSTDHTFRDALSDFNDRMDSIQSGKWHQYQPTYVTIWDELLAGLERGKLILIGAYPSVGKSALEATILLERASRGHKDGLFTLEDPKLWLAKRYVSRASGIPVRRLMQRPEKDGSGGLTAWQMEKVARAYESAELWWDNMRIDERPGLSAYQIATKSRQWVRKHGVETIWVDNASEVSLDDAEGDRHDLRTARMVRVLRDVAKTCDIPVVLLVHFKRPKANNAKEPRFIRPTSDLWKNAGAFEEASRVAVGLWLDETNPGGVVGTILKQSEGAKDVDFFMPMHESAGLIQPHGGVRCGDTKGYSESTEEAA